MQYQLHDYEVDSITFEDNKIIFSFPNGFYVTDDNGQEIMPPRKKLVFTVDRDNFPNDPVESFVTFRRINRRMNGWKEISFKQFSSLFKYGNMDIHDEYDSKLTNWKIIQMNANTKRSNIELHITDIINIEFML